MRALTLGELLSEAARYAIDPASAVIVVAHEPVTAGGDGYEIVHRRGGVTVEFTADCDGDHGD